MPYRGGLGEPKSRFAASFQAIVPASIISGVAGMTALMAIYLVAAAFAGEIANPSIEELLSVLVVGGGAIALGSIAGIFFVAFHLLVFGLPVALLLGDRIRTRAGLLIAISTGIAAALVVGRWLWSIPTASSGEADLWGQLLVLGCFAVPAAWFYRQNVIAMLDELQP